MRMGQRLSRQGPSHAAHSAQSQVQFYAHRESIHRESIHRESSKGPSPSAVSCCSFFSGSQKQETGRRGSPVLTQRQRKEGTGWPAGTGRGKFRSAVQYIVVNFISCPLLFRSARGQRTHSLYHTPLPYVNFNKKGPRTAISPLSLQMSLQMPPQARFTVEAAGPLLENADATLPASPQP